MLNIVDYFKGKGLYSTAFSKVQKQIEGRTTLSSGRYDAKAFECLCDKMDKISDLKTKGLTLEEALDSVLPKSVKEIYDNGIPMDYRIQPFYYLSSIMAIKHIYSEQPEVAKLCGEKFTATVQQMVSDSVNYKAGRGVGVLRDCSCPEEAGYHLQDMQEGFNSELGETLRAEGLGPVMEVAQETIACTDMIKPYFEDMRLEEGKIQEERSVLELQLRKLDERAEIVKLEGSNAIVSSLEGFNPFAVAPEQQ